LDPGPDGDGWSEETGRGERQSEGETKAMKVRKHDGRYCKRIKIEEGREGRKDRKKEKEKKQKVWTREIESEKWQKFGDRRGA
jgi:hypothetical protein